MQCIDSYVLDPGEIFKDIYLTVERGIVSCSVWDLVPRLGMEPGPPAMGAQSLSHWTTTEIPGLRGNCDFKDILTLLMNTSLLFKIYTNT